MKTLYNQNLYTKKSNARDISRNWRLKSIAYSFENCFSTDNRDNKYKLVSTVYENVPDEFDIEDCKALIAKMIVVTPFGMPYHKFDMSKIIADYESMLANSSLPDSAKTAFVHHP